MKKLLFALAALLFGALPAHATYIVYTLAGVGWGTQNNNGFVTQGAINMSATIYIDLGVNGPCLTGTSCSYSGQQMNAYYNFYHGGEASAQLKFDHTLTGWPTTADGFVSSSIWFNDHNPGPVLTYYGGNLALVSVVVTDSPGGYDVPIRTSYTWAVPEPGTWALMIAGFGIVGGALRRRPRAWRVAAA